MTRPRSSSSPSSRAVSPRKPYRFSQTATPDHLLPVSAQEALMAVWGLRVRYWQRRPEQTPTWRWGRDSEPLEPEHQDVRCPSHILHSLRIRTLLDLLEMELERGLRLLLGSRGRYWGEDSQVPLTGVLGRIGQMYRELEQRRRDKSSALMTLLLELATLPDVIADAPRPAEAVG